MTIQEIERAIGLLLQTQQLMDKNLQGLFQIVQQNTQDIDRLTRLVETYLRGIQNGNGHPN